MAALVHYVKQDFTTRTTTSTTDVELTDYTISYSALTGAGFVAGDKLAIIVSCRHRCSSNTGYTYFELATGTTFAGRTVKTGQINDVESAQTAADAGHQVLFLAEHNLAANESIYFAGATSTGTSSYQDFTCIVLNADDLTTTNYKYATTSPSGDASTTATDGASVTLGAGDWLIFGMTYWLVDSTSADALMRLNVGGTDYAETRFEGEDTANEENLGTLVYLSGVSGNTTAKVTYNVDTATTHDCHHTAVMALRLDAFKDHWGTRATSTITHSALDIYQEFAGNPSYTNSQTGNLLAIAFPIHTFTEATKRPYGRIQLNNSDWPATGNNRCAACENGAVAKIGPILIGYGSVASGTLDWDFDCAEDADVSPTYSCTEQIAAVFSLELASAGYTLVADSGSYALTGTQAPLLANRILGSDSGVFTLTGTDAALLASYVFEAGALVAESGAELLAESGTFTLAGSDVTLSKGYTLSAEAGTFALDGVPAQTLIARLLVSESGSFAWSGADAGLAKGYMLSAEAGAFALGEPPVQLLLARLLAAEPGVFSLTGSDAALQLARLLVAESGAFSLVGIDAALRPGRLLAAEPGVFSLTGVEAALLLEHLLTAESGAFSLLGADMLMLRGRVLIAGSGAFTLSGADADLQYGGELPGTVSEYLVALRRRRR